MKKQALLELAHQARTYAYAPYSHFQVGAALLAKSGNVYTGCNIENAAYTPGNCAERTAFFKAISEGEQEFTAIAIVGGPEGKQPDGICPPCGVCRQVMMEFCDPELFEIVLEDSGKEMRTFLLKEILPYGFGPDNLI